VVQPDRRSAGEGQSHKARVYVYEESHSGIVPMNHSNKDGTSPAESGEERPLIKENAGQPNTYPTQSGKGVSQGLAGVRKAARENKEMKFTAFRWLGSNSWVFASIRQASCRDQKKDRNSATAYSGVRQ